MIIETAFNNIAEVWKETLQAQFPELTWLVAGYNEVVRYGYTEQVAGDLHPRGFIVSATAHTGTITPPYLVPNALIMLLPEGTVETLITLVGEQVIFLMELEQRQREGHPSRPSAEPVN